MFKTSQSAKKSIHFFLPVFDKHSEFDQTGDIVANSNIYHYTFLHQNDSKKETMRK